MIQYSLICENDHKFEAWFKSSMAFDEQAERGIVTCPICACTRVSKALMAPSITSRSNRESPEQSPGETSGHPPDENPRPPARGTSQEPPQGREKSVSLSSGHPDQARLQKLIREFREKITAEADYVGKDFAAEARRIHEDESRARSIYGEATPDETASLLEDGINIFPLPPLPEEQN